jgi:hypothetical protein
MLWLSTESCMISQVLFVLRSQRQSNVDDFSYDRGFRFVVKASRGLGALRIRLQPSFSYLSLFAFLLRVFFFLLHWVLAALRISGRPCLSGCGKHLILSLLSRSINYGRRLSWDCISGFFFLSVFAHAHTHILWVLFHFGCSRGDRRCAFLYAV